MTVEQFIPSADFRKGAFDALLALREWLDSHSDALNTRVCKKNGEVTKCKAFITPTANKNARTLITAFIENLDTFMIYKQETLVRCHFDDKLTVDRVTVEKNQEDWQ